MYGHLEERLKSETWRLLRHLRARASLPWVCLGYFNEILCSEERNGRIPKLLQPIQDFQSILLHCGLVDLGFQSYMYTWRNGRRGDAFVVQRLNKACTSEDWRELYPQTKVFHMSATYSDHDPILLNTKPIFTRHRRRKKMQQVEEKWVVHLECEDWVRSSWGQTQPIGSLMFCLFEKIKCCRMDLVVWSRNTFGNSQDHINAKQGELEELMTAGYMENLDRIHEIRKEINELMHHEEVFWRQRFHSI